ncbi:MAG: hypothetical protein WBX22_11915 [Silvibacterium sp.]
MTGNPEITGRNFRITGIPEVQVEMFVLPTNDPSLKSLMDVPMRSFLRCGMYTRLRGNKRMTFARRRGHHDARLE